MSAAAPEFIRKQYEFTRHCRDPENNPAPDNIEDRRMTIYRDLLYNNVEGFMANNFPVIREITSDQRWHRMIRDYFANHQSSTPLFPKMPTEFLQYLQDERQHHHDHKEDPDFLLELAHYEWLESALTIDTREIDDTDIDPEGDLLAGIPVLNSLILSLAYEYPVHKISPEYQPDEKQPTYLVIYRNRNDDVGFMELNTVTARLLDKLQQHSTSTGQRLLEEICQELDHPQPQVVIDGGLQVMQHMLSKDILLGTKIGTVIA